MGMPDQGFPRTMKTLESLGYVKFQSPGYVITELGLATVKLNNEKLFGKKKRAKKPKFKDYDETGSDDYEN